LRKRVRNTTNKIGLSKLIMEYFGSSEWRTLEKRVNKKEQMKANLASFRLAIISKYFYQLKEKSIDQAQDSDVILKS
jgi:hypothetical protein